MELDLLVTKMRLTFEGCLFDSDTRQVFRDGAAAPVSPKAFLLLKLLIENRPGAISKEAIRERLWPGTFVLEANLGNLVSELRAALGDDGHSARIIRTVRRFGYAFAAKACVVDPSSLRGRDAAVYRLIWGNREIALAPGENVIGRAPEAVVWIDHSSVSRRHARVVIAANGPMLEDLGSKNGTRVRGKRISGRIPIADGDTIEIGPASLLFKVFNQTDSTASASSVSGSGPGPE
jgi:DNA-binding winged helix-turn-helix (wHTH) protein